MVHEGQVEGPRVRVDRFSLIVEIMRKLIVCCSWHNVGLTSGITFNLGSERLMSFVFILLSFKSLRMNWIPAVFVEHVLVSGEGVADAMFHLKSKNDLPKIIVEPIVHLLFNIPVSIIALMDISR